MKRYWFQLAAACFLVVLPGSRAVAVDAPAIAAVDAAKLLPAPPSGNSAETKEEIVLLLRLQEQRTETDVARTNAEAKLSMSAFEPIFGDWFTAEKLPETDKFFKQMHKDSKAVSDTAKRYFGRARPGVVEPRLNPSLKPDDEPSYPSGHATRGIIYAIVLSEIAPDKKDALLERGREIGWDRVIAGVHYPSDVAAGRTLGQALAQRWLADADFQRQLQLVRKEIEAARPRQEAPVR
jgi:acid phosphatase (class A)